MEMLLLIVLTAHVIALLGYFSRAEAAEAEQELSVPRAWMEECVPVRVATPERELVSRR